MMLLFVYDKLNHITFLFLLKDNKKQHHVLRMYNIELEKLHRKAEIHNIFYFKIHNIYK